MPEASLPPFLLSLEKLDTLIGLLKEKETLRAALKVKGFGAPVRHEDEANRLFAKIAGMSGKVLPLLSDPRPLPRLVLTKHLGDLPKQTLKAYLFFGPLAICLSLLGLALPVTGQMLYLLLGITLFLVTVPLLLHRRTRIHVEHNCRYVKGRADQGEIFIDQLPSIQFQSFLAHEYAHHLYTLKKGQRGKPWMREGWARLVQWHITQQLSETEENPAFLYHALNQIVGELKFACQLVAAALNTSLPRKVLRIRSMYHWDPIFTLLTGTPMTVVSTLTEHAVGTAIYLMMEKAEGLERALWGDAGRFIGTKVGGDERKAQESSEPRPAEPSPE